MSITTQVGERGVGEVDRAPDTPLKREVAIRLLPAALASPVDDREISLRSLHGLERTNESLY